MNSQEHGNQCIEYVIMIRSQGAIFLFVPAVCSGLIFCS